MKTAKPNITFLWISLGTLLMSIMFTLLLLPIFEKYSPHFTGKNIPAWDNETWLNLPDQLENPSQWNSSEHKLFTSRILVYRPQENRVEPLDLSQCGEDAIRYQWKRDNGFSVQDFAMAQTDTDSDGFTNLEEYQADTNPRDATSCPSHIQKLRLDYYECIPFKLVFKGYALDSKGEYEFQINMDQAEKKQTLFVKKGQFIEKTWKIQDFRLKRARKLNPSTNLEQEYNESELDLVSSQGTKITLIKNKMLDSDKSRAHFISLIKNDQPLLGVARGHIFTFHEKSYQLLAVNNHGAVIKDMSNSQKTTVSRMTEKERSTTRQSP